MTYDLVPSDWQTAGGGVRVAMALKYEKCEMKGRPVTEIKLNPNLASLIAGVRPRVVRPGRLRPVGQG